MGCVFQSGGKCLQENLKRGKEVDRQFLLASFLLADNCVQSCCVYCKKIHNTELHAANTFTGA